MFLLEYEGKKIFERYGVPIPKGVVLDVDDTIDAGSLRTRLDEAGLNPPYIVKGQYLFGGRGKAGAVKKASSFEDLLEKLDEVSRVVIRGRRPSHILVEEYIPHEDELYISLLASKSDKSYIILASRYGGVDIEEMAEKGVEIARIKIYPDEVLPESIGKTLSKVFFNMDSRWGEVLDFTRRLFDVVVNEDLLLLEINPLVYTDRGFIALDSKVIVDDNSGFRRVLSNYFEYKAFLTEGEKVAREVGFAYVPLDGDIAVIGNGAGLVMATLDLVAYYNGRPACFLDVGGGASSERISKALEVVYREVKPRKIFLNIFAGITRCDEVAKGVVEAVNRVGIPKEMFVIRLVGTLEDVGRDILSREGFKVYKDMDEAARKVVYG